MDNNLISFFSKNSRSVVGGISGFVFGFFLIQYGFLKTMLLTICILTGIFVANRLKNVNIRKLLIELLSKGDKE